MSEESEFEDAQTKNKMSEERAVEEDGEDDEEVEGEAPEDREMLFLIEFLVDTLYIVMKNLNTRKVDPCMLNGQSCVVLKFLNFPAMNVCEKDWGSDTLNDDDDVIKFNSGKSLIFALSESQFSNPPLINLEVSAHKMMPHGSLDPIFPIGKTKICLSELFKQVFDKIYECPGKLPLSKSIKDNYQLMGANSKKVTAEVTIYIRLSCLGQNVVTEFQRGGDECDPFLFKNRESDKMYECKAKNDASERDRGDACSPFPQCGTSNSKAVTRYQDEGLSNVGDDDQGYDEFGTEVHGHFLTIKILKGRKDDSKNRDDCRESKGGCLGNQISFKVPRDQKLCKAGASQNKATVLNLKDCKPVGDDEESEDKDVFVLRIGKKGEVDGKGKLELELRTPKQKQETEVNVPKKLHKEVQTDKEEAPKKGKKK